MYIFIHSKTGKLIIYIGEREQRSLSSLKTSFTNASQFGNTRQPKKLLESKLKQSHNHQK